jgi:pilus assembly protein CpaF
MELSLADLKPFLPGLEAVLEDDEVSEVMINGPGQVFVERRGRVEPMELDLSDEAVWRAAIQIARPLGKDPEAEPIIDARLGDGSRVAICSPPAAPHAAITIRRFGGREFTLAELQELGSLPPPVVTAAEDILRRDGNLLIAGGTGSGKTTLLNALASLFPAEGRVVSIEDTLELQLRRANCVRFEARSLTGDVTIRDLVRHSLRHRPDHIVVGEVRGAEASDLLQALNTGHGGSLATVHANNATLALSRLASCAMQASDALPWAVVCRGVVDGIEAVIHQARTPTGERRVEQMVRVRDYDAGNNRWVVEAIWPAPAATATAASSAGSPSPTPTSSRRSSAPKRRRKRSR